MENKKKNNFEGEVELDNVEEARLNLKKWREEFSKDAEKRHKKIFRDK